MKAADKLRRKRDEGRKKILETLKFFENSAGNRVNCIKLVDGQSTQHLMKEILECLDIFNEGKSFVNECYLEDHQLKPDVVNLSDREITEVVETETMESLRAKKEKYEEMGFSFVAKRANPDVEERGWESKIVNILKVYGRTSTPKILRLMNCSRPTVSKYVNILRNSGIVEHTKEGPVSFWEIKEDADLSDFKETPDLIEIGNDYDGSKN